MWHQAPSRAMIAKQKLRQQLYNLQMARLLTSESQGIRLQLCRKLILLATGQQYKWIALTDEKLFIVEQTNNCHINRSWSTEALNTLDIIENRQNPQSNMIWWEFVGSTRPLVSVEQRSNRQRPVRKQNPQGHGTTVDPASLLVKRNVVSSRTILRPTGRHRLRCGAKLICGDSSHLHIHRRTLWI